MTHYTVLAVFSIWLAWAVAEQFLEAPQWAWRCAAGVLGMGAQVLIDWEHWWWGLGIGGAAALLSLVADLLMLLGDWVRMSILRRNR